VSALAFGVSSALGGSGSGGVVNLGQSNTVNAQTALSGNTTSQLRVSNASTVAGALSLTGLLSSAAPGTSSAAVRGVNSGTNANGYGVWGSHAGSGSGVYGTSVKGIGVYGRHTSTLGTAAGVRGESASGDYGATAVQGVLTATSGGINSAAVR